VPSGVDPQVLSIARTPASCRPNRPGKSSSESAPDKWVHTAVVVDVVDGAQDTISVSADRGAYEQLDLWEAQFGQVLGFVSRERAPTALGSRPGCAATATR
jgi:hypothetical protein